MGKPAMVCPMDTYMSGTRRTRDVTRRLFRIGVSLSASMSSDMAASAAGAFCPCPASLALPSREEAP